MNSHDYWKKRAEGNALRIYQYSDRKSQLVTRWFGRAQREMQQTITAFYRRYAQSEQITLPQAKAALTNRRSLSLTLEQYRALAAQNPLDSVAKRLLEQSYLSRTISREEFLIMQLNLLASELYDGYAMETEKSLTEIFEQTYYKSIFDYQQFIGFGASFNRISTHQIEAATSAAWKGKNYSERIWGGHRQTLARYLNRIVTNGFIQGQSNGDMVIALQKAMDASEFDARRLIRTECAQVASRANMLSYQENGTPQFKFLATLDYKTSAICRSMDGKIFAVADGVVGVNMSPLHPFCRSTTVPYIPDDAFDRDNTRIARNSKSETYKVPADMTYSRWYRKYVENDSAEMLAQTKYRNGRVDAAQLKKYAALLERDAPKSLDEFQNIKYTDDVQMRFMELDYRRRNRLQQNPALALPNAHTATAADAKFTGYLFNPNNADGRAKGQSITHRLGYSTENWKELKNEIEQKALQYPATIKQLTQYGQKYEQKIIVNGLKGTPANMVLGWIDDNGQLRMTSAYIKEVD